MNGKKARAIRRAGVRGPNKTEDQQRILRHNAAIKARTQPKPLRERKRKKQKEIKPTWPRTADQKAQSRPVIVVHPLRRAFKNGMFVKNAKMIRELGAEPKYALDDAANLKPNVITAET